MARYRYIAVALDGRSLEGEADAADESSVAAELGARGLILVEAKRLAAAKGGGLFAAKADAREVTNFLGELSLMLRSGLTIDEALLLASQELKPTLARVIKGLRQDILSGQSFVQALQRHAEVFPPEVVAMARVADATGHLDRVLAAVAAQRGRSHVLADKVTSALRYPAFLLLAAAGVLVFFLMYVVPQFAGIIGDLGPNQGGFVLTVLGLSQWLSDHAAEIGIGAAVVLTTGLLVSRIQSVRVGFLRAATRLPVIKGIWQLRRTALFTSNLGTMLSQGVPLIDALKVLESVVGAEGEQAVSEVGDKVRRGGRLFDALMEAKVLPEVAVRMLRIGEETGELATVASEAGALYEKKLGERLDRVGALIGPLAIMVIATVIGGLMVTIMSALMSVNQLVM